MKTRRVSQLSFGLLAVAGLGAAGCDSDEVKVIDVPRKDIPKEMYNKPIPPEAFKTMPPAARKQMKKMEETIKSSKTE